MRNGRARPSQRDERQPDDEGVEQHADRERERERLHDRVCGEDEAGEHRRHDQGGSYYDSVASLHAGGYCMPGIAVRAEAFAHPAHQEHLVVHGQPEQDTDEQHRDEADDGRGRRRADCVAEMPVLKYPHHHAQAGRDRQQESEHGLERHEQCTESDGEQDEGQHDDESDERDAVVRRDGVRLCRVAHGKNTRHVCCSSQARGDRSLIAAPSQSLVWGRREYDARGSSRCGRELVLQQPLRGLRLGTRDGEHRRQPAVESAAQPPGGGQDQQPRRQHPPPVPRRP